MALWLRLLTPMAGALLTTMTSSDFSGTLRFTSSSYFRIWPTYSPRKWFVIRTSLSGYAQVAEVCIYVNSQLTACLTTTSHPSIQRDVICRCPSASTTYSHEATVSVDRIFAGSVYMAVVSLNLMLGSTGRTTLLTLRMETALMYE